MKKMFANMHKTFLYISEARSRSELRIIHCNMKFKIEVELEPEEVPLATELLMVLREITQHINVKTTKDSLAPAQLFRSLIEQCVDPEQMDSISASINSLLEQNPEVKASMWHHIAFCGHLMLPCVHVRHALYVIHALHYSRLKPFSLPSAMLHLMLSW